MQRAETDDYLALGRLLDRCADLDASMSKLLDRGWNVGSQRQALAMAFCRASLAHAQSQRILIGAELHSTALALIRLQFETTVRAAWVLLSAKDDWIERFTAPMPSGEMKEPVKGPDIYAMLVALETVAPDLSREGRQAHETVKVMHSFVHGGIHLVVHALQGYPPSKLVNVLRNRNFLLLMLGNVIVIASGNLELQGSVGRLSREYADSMPPVPVEPKR